MKNDILDGFCWHSSVDTSSENKKRFVRRLPRSKKAMSMFIAASDGLLIHKTTKCLWRISDDKKSIEPVFGSDVLSDEEVDGIVAED